MVARPGPGPGAGADLYAVGDHKDDTDEAKQHTQPLAGGDPFFQQRPHHAGSQSGL